MRKLRFVPAARKKATPWIAGAGAAIISAPVAAFLPLVGGLTAAAFGAGVFGGVKSGSKELDGTNVWGDKR